MTFTSQPTQWGIKNEAVARKQYFSNAVRKHEKFKCQGCRLVLNTDYSVFGASADGLISCRCCGLWCLEIKCLFVLKHGQLCDVPCLTGVSWCVLAKSLKHVHLLNTDVLDRRKVL